MRYILSFGLLLSALVLSAQDGTLVVEFPVVLKNGGWTFMAPAPRNEFKDPSGGVGYGPLGSANDVDVVPSVDEQSFLNLLLLDKGSVSAVTFNTNFEQVNAATIPRSKEEGNVFDDFNEITGSISSNGITTLFLSNGSNKKYGALQYDWKTQTFTHHTKILLELDKEDILDAQAIGNKFYLATIVKGTSTVKVHIFDDAPKVKSLSFDMRSHVFSSVNRELYYSLLTNRAEAAIAISPIYYGSMQSLPAAADRRKIYFTPDKIYITIDDRDVYTNLHTRLITLDLVVGDALVELIKIPTVNCSEFGSNSFIFEDKLFQVVACDKELVIIAKKFGSNEVIREFRATSEDTISFKNTPIIQEGGRFDGSKKKAHENTRKFLNAIGDTKAGTGICLNRLPSGNIEFTLGSFKELTTRFGMINSPGGSRSFYYNPNATTASFSITSERAIYLKGLLNPTTLESVSAMAELNAMEKIAARKLNKNWGATIIWIKGACYFGYYDKTRKLYRIERY